MRINTKEIVKKHKIKLTKSLGQNFLIDENVVNSIVDTANISKRDLVIEIGPGVGSMTAELALRAGRVIAVEIDKYLIPALSESLKEFDNVDIINKDILKVNIDELIGESVSRNCDSEVQEKKYDSVKVVANLPYYITTPIIMKLLEGNTDAEKNEIGLKIDTMVFMIQKEVANRMVASPGGKDYGSLSIAVQYFSKVEKVFEVPPHCFMPQPDVYSTVIKLNIYSDPPVKLADRGFFTKTVKAAFGQRRKTLANALYNSGYFKQSKDEICEILVNMGIEERQRGETLSIMQFAELANSFYEKNR
jgi:16S rRNA (adenine1518-N6/adenine1519-N6)-dimethyltransferase